MKKIVISEVEDGSVVGVGASFAASHRLKDEEPPVEVPCHTERDCITYCSGNPQHCDEECTDWTVCGSSRVKLPGPKLVNPTASSPQFTNIIHPDGTVTRATGPFPKGPTIGPNGEDLYAQGAARAAARPYLAAGVGSVTVGPSEDLVDVCARLGHVGGIEELVNANLERLRYAEIDPTTVGVAGLENAKEVFVAEGDRLIIPEAWRDHHGT